MKPNKYLDSFIEKNKKVLSLQKDNRLSEKQFLKVYIASNEVLSRLRNSTKIIYEYLFHRLQQTTSYNKTRLLFTYKDYVVYCNDNFIECSIKEASFYRARNELIKFDIIDETETSGYYYFNVNFFFNGDRLEVALNYIKDNKIKDDIDINPFTELKEVKQVLNEDIKEEILEEVKKPFIKKKNAFQS